jgi:DNA-binding transcriptional ArsR family regulator
LNIFPPAHHKEPVIVNKVVEDQALDRAYAALADPTRKWLLETLRQGDARITDLAAPLPITFAGVSRHIGVLESARLVRREVRGREHWLSSILCCHQTDSTNSRMGGQASAISSPPTYPF